MTPETAQATESRLRALISGESVPFNSPQEKFDALAEVWDDHHVGRARIDHNHPAYHQIIGMGEAAVPMLLDRLRKGEAGWIYALKCITCLQVEPPESRGDPRKVMGAWLEWGEKYAGGRLGRL